MDRWIRYLNLVTIMMLLVISGFSGTAAGDPLAQQTFAPFSDLLGKFLIEKSTTEVGLVSAFDYRGAMSDAHTGRRLQEQRRRLVQFDVAALKAREQAIAFWVNTYNFFIAAHILENPKGGQPVAGVKDYGSLYGKATPALYHYRALYADTVFSALHQRCDLIGRRH